MPDAVVKVDRGRLEGADQGRRRQAGLELTRVASRGIRPTVRRAGRERTFAAAFHRGRIMRPTATAALPLR